MGVEDWGSRVEDERLLWGGGGQFVWEVGGAYQRGRARTRESRGSASAPFVGRRPGSAVRILSAAEGGQVRSTSLQETRDGAPHHFSYPTSTNVYIIVEDASASGPFVGRRPGSTVLTLSAAEGSQVRSDCFLKRT